MNNLEFKASKKQIEALRYLMDDTTTEIGYGGAAGGGKSFIGVFRVRMMAKKYPGTRRFFGRKELTNLMKTTYASYLKFCQIYQVPEVDQGKLDGKHNIIRFPNGSEILLLDLAYKQYTTKSELLQVQPKTHHILNKEAEIKSVLGKSFCVMRELHNNDSILKNAVLKFSKRGTYLFSYKMRYKGSSSSSIGSGFTIGRVGKDVNSLQDNFVKTTTPGLSYGEWVFSSGSGIGNIQEMEEVYCYFTGGSITGFEYRNLEVVVDIIKIS